MKKRRKWLDNSHFTKKDAEKEKKWVDVAQYVKKDDAMQKKWLDMSQFTKKNIDLGELEKKWLDMAQFSKKWLDNTHFTKKSDSLHLNDKKWIDASNFAKKWIDSVHLPGDKRTLHTEEENTPSSNKVNACVQQNCVGMATLDTLVTCAVECRKRPLSNQNRQEVTQKGTTGSDERLTVSKKWVDPLAYGFDRKRSRDVYQRLRQCYWARCNDRLSDA